MIISNELFLNRYKTMSHGPSKSWSEISQLRFADHNIVTAACAIVTKVSQILIIILKSSWEVV